MYDLFISSVGQFGQYLVLCGVLLALLIIAYLIIDKRYPKVNFICFEGNRMTKLTRRLMNDMVVMNDLIKILMNGNTFVGFKISEFDYIYSDNKRMYLTTRKGQDLIPLRYNGETIDILELGSAREIAMRYINAIDSVDRNMDKQNPIILAIISVLPIAVVLLLTGAMCFLILNDALPKLLEVNIQLSADNVRMAELNQQITGTLEKLVNQVGMNQTNTELNQTFYVQNSGV